MSAFYLFLKWLNYVSNYVGFEVLTVVYVRCVPRGYIIVYFGDSPTFEEHITTIFMVKE
jgi:hypothetical protein